jgi:hypothetical protein
MAWTTTRVARVLWSLGVYASLVAGVLVQTTPATGSKPKNLRDELSAAQFKKLHQMIRPQPGESKWMDLPWETSLGEARSKAAKQGKPIFLMAAGGGSPLGFC